MAEAADARKQPGESAKMKYAVVLICTTCLVACSAHPEKKLLGKWQSEPLQTTRRTEQIAFEFFGDGTVVYSRRLQPNHPLRDWGSWESESTGTFRLIDPKHLKLDWGPLADSDVYEVEWRDQNRIQVHTVARGSLPGPALEGTHEFERVK